MANKTTLNIRPDAIYPGGIAFEISEGGKSTSCFFCGYVGTSVHLSIHPSKGGSPISILLMPKSENSIIEVESRKVALSIDESGGSFIKLSGNLV